MKLPVTLGDGAYRLEYVLGRGGMAVVYAATVDLDHFDFDQLIARANMSRSESRKIKLGTLCRHSQPSVRPARTADYIALCERRGIRYPGHHVAVKVLEHSPAQSRFEDECLNLMALDHPNLIRVYGGGRDGEHGVDYYAMELIEHALSRDEMIGLALESKLEIIRQAAAGLRHLHRNGLIHRDIKPPNILATWTDDGLRAYVTDLGIAKDIERSLELTGSRSVIGTPAYMAPEVVRDASDISPRADVYALGATLYHLVSGRAPYAGDSLYNILTRIISGTPPPDLLELEPDLPRAVAELIGRMMAFEPDQRPTDAEQLIFELDSLCAELSDGPSRPRHPSEPCAPDSACQILIAESDAQIRDLLARFLTRAHYVTETAADGAELLLRLGSGDIDLVIASAHLPVLDGHAMVRAMRAQGIDVPVILLVADQETTDVPDDDLVDIVTKPISLPDLVTKLEHIRSLL